MTGHFEFYIRNSKSNIENETASGGIGLQNIKKRLEMLYNESYELLITETDIWYEVRLKIMNLDN